MTFNWFAVNDQAVNSESLPISEIIDSISFNNFWLQNSNIVTSWENFWLRNSSRRDINILSSPQIDWEILNSAFFRGRNITIEWFLVVENNIDLDDLIDDFKLKLSPKNKLLKWKVNWITRQILATMENIQFWAKNCIIIPYTITFKSQESFWSNEIQQSLPIWIVSSSPRTEQVNNNWQSSFPYILLGFSTWLSSVTSINIISNWIWITINESISDNDILIIDWREKCVKLNDVEIDFDGIFPILENGSNTLIFTINWTFSVDISLVYKLNLL